MTYSICVRERYDADGERQVRFGVAATTRVAGVGTFCPFANEHGADGEYAFTGEDKREELHVQSGAVRVARTDEPSIVHYYDDLRVDATETPIADLRETFEYAVESYRMALERYGTAFADDAKNGK